MAQLNYLFKFGNYDFKGMIKADSYDATPKARQDVESSRDANGDLIRNALPYEHAKTYVTFTIRAHTLEEHKAMMKKITGSYINKGERDANCSYWDDEYCEYKTGHFYIDSNWSFHTYSTATGLPMYGEKTISFVEY